MRLNPECVRDVLLFLETEQSIAKKENGELKEVSTNLKTICDNVSNYSEEEIYYTLARLDEGGYISLATKYGSGGIYSCYVHHITYYGHEFLEKIRPETTWEKTKSVAGKIGNFSLQMIEKIAEGITIGYINSLISGN